VTTMELEVICPGMLEVLSIGKGDLKISIGCDNEEDIEKGRRLIEEMLTKGYSIFVETDEGPVRVARFNPNRMTYIIKEIVEEPAEEQASAAPDQSTEAAQKKPRRARRTVEKEVPVRGSKATAVGKTAGG
jgi:hypothetical protein